MEHFNTNQISSILHRAFRPWLLLLLTAVVLRFSSAFRFIKARWSGGETTIAISCCYRLRRGEERVLAARGRETVGSYCAGPILWWRWQEERAAAVSTGKGGTTVKGEEEGEGGVRCLASRSSGDGERRGPMIEGKVFKLKLVKIKLIKLISF